MKYFNTLIFYFLLIAGGCQDTTKAENPPITQPTGNAKTDVQAWITSPSQKVLFNRSNASLIFNTQANNYLSVNLDESQTYQSMDGFGFCLTGGSALLIHQMDQASRSSLLKELFARDSSNIGVSYLRLSIGASDLSDHVFTYDDLQKGEKDTSLQHFSLEPEKKDLIPVLKEIIAINPGIKILGSPWTAPVWMKTNQDSRGGSLLPEYFDAYARYFVKYIQGMQSEGIAIDAITIQNEPLHPGNNPSMYMTAEDQALFIKKSLGPAFRKAGIVTRIIVYDHNANRPDYPITIYKDQEAAAYVDGAAFHLYEGKIDTLTSVHNAYPDKNLYFTEQWVGAPGNLAEDLSWHVRNLIIGASRNWCKTVLEWNLAADPNNNPHTDRGGCSECLGAVTLNGNNVSRNPAYYIIAHASKFVTPGSVRIWSSLPKNLPNVAFKTAEGKKVLIVLNDTGATTSFNIQYAGKWVTAKLDKGAVGTYIW